MCKSENRRNNRDRRDTVYPASQKGSDTIRREKEFLYVGHYVDTKGRYILKIGTTNDLKRRAAEHTRNYKKTREFTMPENSSFVYDWWRPLSKYNTLRYEDANRARWQDMGIGRFIRNDRFFCERKPDMVTITIRKTYTIPLA